MAQLKTNDPEKGSGDLTVMGSKLCLNTKDSKHGASFLLLRIENTFALIHGVIAYFVTGQNTSDIDYSGIDRSFHLEKEEKI